MAVLLAALAVAACDRPGADRAAEPTALPALSPPRTRRAAIAIRFDNGRTTVGDGTLLSDRLRISAVFGDVDVRDTHVVDALAGLAAEEAAQIAPDHCMRVASTGPGGATDLAPRPRAWVQLLDVGNLELRAAAQRAPLRVGLVPAVIEATRGVRYDLAVDSGRAWLAAGRLTVVATGGDGVAGFSAPIDVPRPVRVTQVGDQTPVEGTIRGLGRPVDLTVRWGSVDGRADLELRVGSEAPGAFGWLRCHPRDDGAFTLPPDLIADLPERRPHRPWAVVIVRRTAAQVAGFAGTPLRLEVADRVHVE